MRILVSGATGLIGSATCKLLAARGDQVVALSRDSGRANAQLGAGVEVHEWRSPTSEPPPPTALEGTDAVIHLVGEPIGQRWTSKAKREVRASRLLSTRLLVSSLATLAEKDRPGTLVCQSAVGYYGPRGDEEIGEDAPPGNDFLAGLVADWEHEAEAARQYARVVCTRTGVVLSPRGGALAKMLPPFRLGLGGPIAGGRQYVPWVHLDDVAAALVFSATDGRVTGPVNLTAPAAVTNREFSRALAKVLRRPALVPVPAVALWVLYGQMSSIVVTGQRAVPARLQEAGFQFRYNEVEPALRDVLSVP